MKWRLTSLQADELRALPRLTALNTIVDACNLQLLLRTPHQLQWQKLRVWGDHFSADAAGLLASLSTLTDLTVKFSSDLELLQHVPNLRTLQLSGFDPCDLTPEQMLAPLGQLAQLTHLVVFYCRIRSNHMSALLSCAPTLSKLELDGVDYLDSLAFLSDSVPLQQSLTSLSISDSLDLPAAQLHHLFSLTQLAELTLGASLTKKMDPLTLQELQLPSSRLPKLVKFTIDID